MIVLWNISKTKFLSPQIFYFFNFVPTLAYTEIDKKKKKIVQENETKTKTKTKTFFYGGIGPKKVGTWFSTKLVGK